MSAKGAWQREACWRKTAFWCHVEVCSKICNVSAWSLVAADAIVTSVFTPAVAEKRLSGSRAAPRARTQHSTKVGPIREYLRLSFLSSVSRAFIAAFKRSDS